MSSISSFPWSELPEELKLHCLSYLPPTKQCEFRGVCKEWSDFFSVLWKPIFREFHPSVDRITYKNTEVTQTEVLADIHTKQKDVDLILSLIENDSELEAVIGCPSMSLEQPKKCSISSAPCM